MRALDPEVVIDEMKSLKLVKDVRILEKDSIQDLLKYDEIVVPDDDVMRELVPRYLDEKKVVYDSVFLRWHKMNSVTQNPVNNNSQISITDFDRQIMKQAQDEAGRSSDWWRHVGAVLVKDNKIIFSQYNKHSITENTAYIEGEPRSNFDAGKDISDLVIFQHGEARIIAEAARTAVSTEGASLYVTTFPCPSCAMLVANAGINRVYYMEGYSLLDAERILKQAKIEIVQVI